MVIILRGCSGAGKSTFSKKELEGRDPDKVVICSADHYFEDGAGNYNFDPKKLPNAHASCGKKFTEAVRELDDSHTIFVDNTNTTGWEACPYAAVAGWYGHTIKILTIVVDPEKAHARNTHGVPFKTVQAQNDKLLRSIGKFPKWWPEEVIDG